MKNSMSSLSLVAIVLALPMGVALANGQGNLQALLRGDYHFVGSETCIVSSDGFSPHPYFAPLGPSSDRSENYITGVINFDGQGSAVATVAAMSINANPAVNLLNFSINTASLTCTYQYNVNPDRSFTMVPECAGDIPIGAPGTLLKITGGLVRGSVGQHPQTLQAATVEPVVEYLTVNDVFTVPRLCSRVLTYQRAWHGDKNMQ